MSKITVIGAAGRVGSNAAREIAGILAQDDELILMDIPPALNGLRGIVIDIKDAALTDAMIVATDDRKEIAGADIVVVTAGKPRGPGMTREQLLLENSSIIKGIGQDIGKYAPCAKVIVVSNPMDIMAYVLYKSMGCRPNQVTGMGGALDSRRYRKFLAQEFGCKIKDVEGAVVLGAHGEGMVPITSTVRIKGKKPNDMEKVEEAGKQAVVAGKTMADFGASAYFGPAPAITSMVKAILADTKEVIPSSVLASGEFGIKGIFIGLPAKIGKNGVEEIVEIGITPAEKEKLKDSAKSIRRAMEPIEGADPNAN